MKGEVRLTIPKSDYRGVSRADDKKGWTTESGSGFSTPDWVFATLNCPKCTAPVSLNKKFNTIDGNGRVSPKFVCPHPGCGLGVNIRLLDWVPLWCVAYEVYQGIVDRKPRWKPEMLYLHAATQADAKRDFLAGESDNLLNTRIVDIGSVIGYTSADDDGKVMSV